MKFNIKYPNMVPLVDEIGGIVCGCIYGPCCVCGEQTKFVDIDAEMYVCSEECEDAMYTDLQKSLDEYYELVREIENESELL